MGFSRMDYEAMLQIARTLSQGAGDLAEYLGRAERAAQGVRDRCQSPFAEALIARHEAWARQGDHLRQALEALAVDLARIVRAQQTAEEETSARIGPIPE